MHEKQTWADTHTHTDTPGHACAHVLVLFPPLPPHTPTTHTSFCLPTSEHNESLKKSAANQHTQLPEVGLFIKGSNLCSMPESAAVLTNALGIGVDD